MLCHSTKITLQEFGENLSSFSFCPFLIFCFRYTSSCLSTKRHHCLAYYFGDVGVVRFLLFCFGGSKACAVAGSSEGDAIYFIVLFTSVYCFGGVGAHFLFFCFCGSNACAVNR